MPGSYHPLPPLARLAGVAGPGAGLGACQATSGWCTGTAARQDKGGLHLAARLCRWRLLALAAGFGDFLGYQRLQLGMAKAW